MSNRGAVADIYAARDDVEAVGFRAAYEDARRAYEFGVLARALRKAAELTQNELAARMGTTASAIARLEAGGTSPTLVTRERPAAALGVQPRARGGRQ